MCLTQGCWLVGWHRRPGLRGEGFFAFSAIPREKGLGRLALFLEGPGKSAPHRFLVAVYILFGFCLEEQNKQTWGKQTQKQGGAGADPFP